MLWLFLTLVVLQLCCGLVDGKVRLRLVERKQQDNPLNQEIRRQAKFAKVDSAGRSKLNQKNQQALPDNAKETSEPFLSSSLGIFKNIAVCAVVRDEDTYINDWIDYHLLLGFNAIHIFDNSINGSAKVAYLPQQYGTSVKVNHAPGEGIQLEIYNLFVQHIARVATDPMWAAFIDVDEYIVLRKHASIQSFLAEVAPTGGAVALNRIQFGSNGHLQYENAPVLSRFITRKSLAEKVLKTIVYIPDLVVVGLNESVLRDGVYAVNPHGNRVKPNYKVSNSSISIACINHYYTKSLEEYKAKKLRGHALEVHMNTQYNTTIQSDNLILTEFIKADAGSNAVEDTFAWDFYKKKVAERSLMQ